MIRYEQLLESEFLTLVEYQDEIDNIIELKYWPHGSEPTVESHPIDVQDRIKSHISNILDRECISSDYDIHHLWVLKISEKETIIKLFPFLILLTQ